MILNGLSGMDDGRMNIRVGDPTGPFWSYDPHSANFIMMWITALTTTCYRQIVY